MITVSIFIAFCIFFDRSFINNQLDYIILVICLFFGSYHLYALLHYPKMEMIRAFICWISGSFWMWVSFLDPFTIFSLATFALGFFNVVAFIVNMILLKEKWNLF
jgi:hypothetical protein